MAHIGLLFLETSAKFLVEMAIEHYVQDIKFKNHKILSSHLKEITSNENPKIQHGKSDKHKKYCTLDQTIEKLERSNTTLSKNILQKITELHDCNKGNLVIKSKTSSPASGPEEGKSISENSQIDLQDYEMITPELEIKFNETTFTKSSSPDKKENETTLDVKINNCIIL